MHVWFVLQLGVIKRLKAAELISMIYLQWNVKNWSNAWNPNYMCVNSIGNTTEVKFRSSGWNYTLAVLIQFDREKRKGLGRWYLVVKVAWLSVVL